MRCINLTVTGVYLGEIGPAGPKTLSYQRFWPFGHLETPISCGTQGVGWDALTVVVGFERCGGSEAGAGFDLAGRRRWLNQST